MEKYDRICKLIRGKKQNDQRIDQSNKTKKQFEIFSSHKVR